MWVFKIIYLNWLIFLINVKIKNFLVTLIKNFKWYLILYIFLIKLLKKFDDLKYVKVNIKMIKNFEFSKIRYYIKDYEVLFIKIFLIILIVWEKNLLIF